MPTTFRDYYATLGVPRTATEAEVHRAFRKLARKHHPDVNPGDKDAEQRFKEINEAHEVLGDPEKRKKYDELGPRWQEYEAWERAGRPGQNPFAAAGGDGTQFEYRTVSPDELEGMFGDASPFSDFFQTFFGGAGRAQGFRGRRGTVRRERATRGEDVQGEAEITLDEAFRGTSRTIQLDEAGQRRRVEVKIPAGIQDGARVRAAGQGGHGAAGGASGDLYVRVRIRDDPRFQRSGADLQTTVEVPLQVAIAGGTVGVPAAGGRQVELRIPPATQNGAKLRMRGLGMPRLRGEGRGDLIAIVDVRLPQPPPEALRRWAESASS